jgi:hypothetical protein
VNVKRQFSNVEIGGFSNPPFAVIAAVLSQIGGSVAKLRLSTIAEDRMSATFKELSDRIGQVGDLYARVHAIERSADWYLLKLTEELGELTAEHLLMAGRAKPNADGSGGTREALENEAPTCSGSSFCIFAQTKSTSRRPSSANGSGVSISMLLSARKFKRSCSYDKSWRFLPRA